jgi:hypothetical protein
LHSAEWLLPLFSDPIRTYRHQKPFRFFRDDIHSDHVLVVKLRTNALLAFTTNSRGLSEQMNTVLSPLNELESISTKLLVSCVAKTYERAPVTVPPFSGSPMLHIERFLYKNAVADMESFHTFFNVFAKASRPSISHSFKS